MNHKYLYPRQRQIEVISAFYVGGLGFFVHFVDVFGGKSPIGWLGLNHSGQMAFGTLLIISAAVWALGVNINGSRWWSPFLRLSAIILDLLISIFVTWQGAGSSATYTYGWITALLMVGAINAARDCMLSWKERTVWTT